MTVFLGHPVLTVTAPMVSPGKGSLGNRINCAGSQAWNAAATGATAAAAIGAARYAANHQDKISAVYNKVKSFAGKAANTKTGQASVNFIKKCANKIASKLNNPKLNAFVLKTFTKAQEITKKVSQQIKSLPKGGRYALLGTLSVILLNGLYKSGQIDQKYTDRAKMEKHFV